MMLSQNERGFTLVEALISVALLSLLLAMLAPTLRQVSVVDQRLRQEISEREEIVAFESLLREALANVHPMPAAHDSSGLQGGTDQLSVYLRNPETGRVENLDVSVDGERVTLRLSPVFASASEYRPETSLAVGRGARFYYFGEVEPRGRLAWSEDWSHNHLPRLVVLDLAPEAGEMRRIEVAVFSRTGLDCQFDSGNGACLGGRT